MWSNAVATRFFAALADAAEFAIKQGDDWAAVVRGYEVRREPKPGGGYPEDSHRSWRISQ
jgi:hypothetical protein